jgi:hypothetical protein
MAKTIGQLTQATTIASGDEFVIEQSGLTKRVAASVVRGGLIDADIDAAADIAGSKLADDAITTAKIDDDAVTTAKIDDDAVTTAKILDANVTPAKLSQPLTLATAQNTTSGTSIDFTGIPSWVKRITVVMAGVSASGTSTRLLQIGDAGGIENTGYVAGCGEVNDTAVSTAGVPLNAPSGNHADETLSGVLILANLSGDTWACQGCLYPSRREAALHIAGTKTLSATLTQVRITTANGTDTFDAGSVNIMYEG